MVSGMTWQPTWRRLVASTLVCFALVLALLAWRVQTGSDPALGSGTSGALTATTSATTDGSSSSSTDDGSSSAADDGSSSFSAADDGSSSAGTTSPLPSTGAS
jgi:hypothetical protein